jgi:hypothetical protein
MPAKFISSRSFWHLLFPQGAEEVVRTQDGKELRITFDDKFLGGIIEARRKFVAIATAHGAAQQPVPCSMMHVIARRIGTGEQPADPKSLDRVGNCYGFALAGEAEGVSPGLYGLIEWPYESLHKIEQGSWMTLSPTTWDQWSMRDGTVIEGPFLGEIGIVDIPALETIGSLRERLPWDALTVQTESVEPMVAADDPEFVEYATALRASMTQPGTAIQRGALHVVGDAVKNKGTMRNGEGGDGGDAGAVGATGAGEGASQREGEGVAAPDVSEIVKTVMDARLSEDDYIDMMVERMTARGYSIPRAAATQGEGDAKADPGADGTVSGASEDEMVRALEGEARKAAQQKVQVAARSGSLPAASCGEALKRAINGKSWDDLLVTPGAASTSRGATTQPGTAPAARPPSTTQQIPASFSDEDICTVIERSSPNLNAGEFAMAVDKLRQQWIVAGASYRSH